LREERVTTKSLEMDVGQPFAFFPMNGEQIQCSITGNLDRRANVALLRAMLTPDDSDGEDSGETSAFPSSFA
jgi:hypothetical protein